MCWKVFVFAVKVFPTGSILRYSVYPFKIFFRTLHADFVQRYAILGKLFHKKFNQCSQFFLAADEAKGSKDPKTCVDNMLGRLVKQKDLDQDNFRVGLTKVFFKAGVSIFLGIF